MSLPHKEKLLLIDIETATEAASFSALNETWQHLWSERSTRSNVSMDADPSETYVQRAGVMAEFARVICISIGYFTEAEQSSFHIRSYKQASEKKLLMHFVEELNELFNSGIRFFAGHNIREFDIPFLCRRFLANQLPIPACMNFQQTKPWDVPVIDTFQLWRFGDYKNFTSLQLLATVLKVPSSKDDMNGSEVGRVYWQGDARERVDAINRITQYCEKDVVATANVLLRLMQQPTIEECGMEIVYIE